MLRPILFVHRWLGIIVGLLMTVWCLSGFVMMYVDYPRLMPKEQIAGLAPLLLPAGTPFETLALPADLPIAAARIEMMADRPVLRIVPGEIDSRPPEQTQIIPTAFDLTTGEPVDEVASGDIAQVAATFGRQSGIAEPPASIAQTDMDQWNVQAYRRNAPLFRADYADSAGTQAYISGKTGEVVQHTTRFERFWGWLGAVPHWLYPTILRQDGALWAQVVIWTSLIGCFLTGTGLWAGVARLRRKRDGSVGSPFAGIWWWHHIFGLFFGILTLTWVASGLFSMSPWGFLDSSAGYSEGQKLAGSVRWDQISPAVARIKEVPTGTVRLEVAPLGGQLFFAATDADGKVTRLDTDGRPAPLRRAELAAALGWASGGQRLELLTVEDSYYYAHKFPAPLPVWRVILTDAERTRLYIDPQTGRLLRAVDSNGRSYRWLMKGLHSLDLPLLRSRPLWDLVVIPLLAAVTFVCGTGTWMGIDKLQRDWRRMRNRRRRRALARATA